MKCKKVKRALRRKNFDKKAGEDGRKMIEKQKWKRRKSMGIG